MSAYAVFTRERTLNASELQLYAEKVASTFAGHPYKTLAAYGRFEDLEGPPTEGTVIIEFPSMEAARAWYDSPAYREVREHRLEGAVYRAVLVEGV
ncbi:MAG TPA: DUF1330 domain-containing protein [Acidobacteriaceae bacterium]|nr:DUF1330 domain-containing protein [Acidobacteriaceae bacterium]